MWSTAAKLGAPRRRHPKDPVAMERHKQGRGVSKYARSLLNDLRWTQAVVLTALISPPRVRARLGHHGVPRTVNP